MDEAESISSLLQAYGPGLSELLSFEGDDGWIGFGLSETELQTALTEGQAGTKDVSCISSSSQPVSAKHKRIRNTSTKPSSDQQNKGSEADKNPKALNAELAAKLAQLSQLKQANTVLEERCKILEYVVAARDEQIARLQEIHDGIDSHNPFEYFGMSVQEFMSMKPADILKTTKHVMSEFGRILMQAGLKGNGAGNWQNAELSRLVQALVHASKYVALMRPDVLLLVSRNVNDAGQGASEDVGPLQDVEPHWAQVAAFLSLAPDQASHAWHLHDLYSIWHAQLMGERVALSRQLSEALGFNRYGATFRTQGVGDLPGAAEQYLLDKLQHNLDKERCLNQLIDEVFAEHVLTAVQQAKLFVQSYPRMPDSIGILAAAAALHAPPLNHPVPGIEQPTPVTTNRDAAGAAAAAQQSHGMGTLQGQGDVAPPCVGRSSGGGAATGRTHNMPCMKGAGGVMCAPLAMPGSACSGNSSTEGLGNALDLESLLSESERQVLTRAGMRLGVLGGML